MLLTPKQSRLSAHRRIINYFLLTNDAIVYMLELKAIQNKNYIAHTKVLHPRIYSLLSNIESVVNDTKHSSSA
jgi:hypothetical protein